MKRKDIALIALISGLSAVFAYALSSYFFNPNKNRQVQVEIVQPITSEFNQPSNKYFNNSSVDPTQTINIGDKTNQDPFQ